MAEKEVFVLRKAHLSIKVFFILSAIALMMMGIQLIPNNQIGWLKAVIDGITIIFGILLAWGFVYLAMFSDLKLELTDDTWKTYSAFDAAYPVLYLYGINIPNINRPLRKPKHPDTLRYVIKNREDFDRAVGIVSAHLPRRNEFSGATASISDYISYYAGIGRIIGLCLLMIAVIALAWARIKLSSDLLILVTAMTIAAALWAAFDYFRTAYAD